MKHVLLFGLMLASFFSYSQYPASGVKQRLGWQTTGDGLVYRGAISDTSTLDPSGINNAWMLLDTVSGNLYAYRIKAWRLVSGGGGGGLSMPFDSVTFNINEGDASEQELKYSADKGYLQYGGLDSVQIPLLPGIWYVRNDTSVTIPKGTVVRTTGTLGASGRIKVKHMIANGTIPAMYVLGIAMQDIAVGADGYVMTQGKIRKVNTTAYSEGAILYADVDTLGGLTQTEPGNGYLKLPIAFVVHSASNGTLAVRIDAGSSLHDLHDVDTAGRVGGSVLQYDSALKYWKASTTAGIVAGDTSVFARDFQISGTSGQVTYFNGANTVTGDANLTWSAANRTLGINTTTTSGANIIIKNTQEPVRDAAWLPQQTFGADTTNWTRGTGWTFNGTQAVATAATGALTYTTLPDTIISGRAYEVTYTLAGYSAGTVTVALGNVSLALPAYNVTGNAVLLQPTSATGGFRFTTSTFTGNLDNVAVVEVRNPAPVLLAGQDDGAATLYSSLRMPNETSIYFGGGGRFSTGTWNTMYGYNAGLNQTTAGANTFFGTFAGQNNATSTSNNFFGSFAGLNNRTGSDNCFFGTRAGQENTTATSNNFFGSFAGQNTTTGSFNIFFGSNAGSGNTTGRLNAFFGESAGRLNRNGESNAFFGVSAGRSNTSGSDNIFFGSSAGYNLTSADTLTGSNNIAIGSQVARNIASSAAGNLVLGNSVNLPTGNASNQVVIKNLIFGTGASGTGTTIQTTAKAGINVNNPQSTLDVEGNMAIGATYSGTTAAPTNGLIVEGNTGIGTSSPQRRLHITGTARVDTLTRDVPTRVLGADADGDLAALTLGTGLSIASGTLNGPSVSGTTNYLPKFTGASSIGNSVIQESGGNIAINATPSAFKLDINGSTHTTGDFYADRASRSSSAGFISAQTNNRWLAGMISNSGSWHVYDLLKSTSVMTLDSATSRVGIGTTTPLELLDVNGVGRFRQSGGAGGGPIEISDRKSTFNQSINWNVYYDGASWKYRNSDFGASIGLNSAGDLLFYNIASGTAANNVSSFRERFRINENGNIGIATASPARSLHITATDAIKIPAGTTAERPSVGITGDLRMNTSPAADSLEYYNGASWVTVQDKLQNPVTGTGTANRLAKFTGTSSLGDSPIVLTGDTLITFGTSTPGLITFNTKDFPITPTDMPHTKFKINTGYGVSGIYMGDPTGPLAASGQAIQLTAWDGSSTPPSYLDYYSARLRMSGTGDFYIDNSTASANGNGSMTTRFTINNAGRIGIGTSTPDSRLTVVSSDSVSALPRISARFSDASQSSLYIAHPTGTSSTAMLIGNGQLGLATSPGAASGYTERVRVASDGKVGIGTTSPARTLHVEGEARISDLTTDTPTRIVGADADGDLGAITLGTGLSISSGTLNASGITSVYIPINLFSPGDTVTNTTNAKNFFLVHSGLNGYCIDSYTVKAIAGTGSADIQVDKNDTGGNLQAISGTTVYTKDTNIALVTGDYIRGQVFNISGTLIGLGLTLEIKATCN